MNSLACSALLLLLACSAFVMACAMTDQATGIAFAPKKNGLEIFGVGEEAFVH